MNKFKSPTEMTKDELKDWIEWAQDEIQEYQEFIIELDEELGKRK